MTKPKIKRLSLWGAMLVLDAVSGLGFRVQHQGLG